MIFSQRDKAEMRKAAHFMWVSEDKYLTYGITPNLVAEVYGEWLDRILAK